ncbi:MAG TPA: TlpA disulfide reductase family protein [Gemmatimonadales bacterium]|nr:TlpA disulfide reductase family protein [Gemmatimonadales bacterium]
MRVRLAGAGLMLALAGLPWAAPAAAQDESGIAVGTTAPIVAVPDLAGQAVNLGQWIGKKPVLLEFWATWCPNCEELLPRLQKAYREVGSRVEFIAVNVTVNQTPERVKRYVESHDVPFLVLYDDKGTSTRAYQAPTTSFVVIVDRAGKVIYTGVGGDQKFEPALDRVAGIHD